MPWCTITSASSKKTAWTLTTAPPGRRMGHAGAIVSGGKGTAEAKIAAFKAAGIGIAVTPSEMADTLLKMM